MRWVSRGPLVAALTMIAITTTALAGCGESTRRFGSVQRTAAPVTRLTGGPPAHVAVIVMENEEYADIIGSAATPYINRLASRYALARSMFAISHPSLPNYLALTGGSTFGITSDCTDCSVGTPGLGGQLLAAHMSWKAYMEDLPRPCFAGSDAGQYAKKHDPFVYYRPIASHRASCAHVVPLTQLGTDERAHTLPRFVWITPNLCHDMHDCSPATGDRFLSHLVPALLAGLGPRGVLFLTWDEGTSDQGCCRLAAGGHVATIVAGPGARAGAQLRTPTDHYSTLQAVEDLLGLSRLRGAACPCTPSLQPLLGGRVRSG
ncbi:MAG: alkaline phosphatase family protein [Solirubrobacteraceae bacterium]